MITANNNTPADPFAMAADAMGKSTDIYSTMGQGAGSLENINEYLNPYYQQVIDAALGRLDRQYDQTMGRIGDAAIGAGAFGGDRHGIVEGTATSDYLRDAGELTSSMMAQNFESSADRAYRDQVTSAQGLTQLGGQYFGVGNTIMQNQAQQGAQQRQFLDELLTQGNTQFENYMSQPYKLIDMMNALLSSDVRRGQGQTTEQSTPGLFDYLALGMQASAGTS